MSNGTIIQQGRFTSAGTAKTLTLRADVDWMEVRNITVMMAGGADTGVKYYWQRGFADDTGIEYQKEAATGSMNNVWMANGGFTRIDTSENPLTAINATGQTISNAAIPIAAMTSTAGLIAGDTIRLVSTVGADQFGGVDFTIDTINANTNVRLVYGPQIVASTTFSFYKVKWAPIFYPTTRYITSISQAEQAAIVMTVTHNYKVGQVVTFNVPDEFGMREINGLQGEITAINDGHANNIVVNINSSTFTPFAWPLTATGAFTHAEVVPVGEGNLQVSAGKFEGSVVNIGYIGMVLGAGVDGPAGDTDDVVYWRAGKSLDVDNE